MSGDPRDELGEVIEISDPDALAPDPLVSVYMAAYGHEDYLGDAIEGVLAQVTEFPIELVIGEDCSPDRSREIAVDYQRRHPSLIRVITGPENLGGRRNARRALGRIRGEFLAYCEGDDYWCHPQKLQRQVELMRANPRLGVVHAGFQNCEFRAGAWRETPVTRHEEKLSGPLFDRIFSTFPLRTCTVLYRREVIDAFRASEFDLPKYPAGDTALGAFCCASWEVGYLDDVVASYRVSPGSATRSGYQSMNRFVQRWIELYEHFRRVYGEREDFDHRFADVIYRRAVDAAFRAGDREGFEAALRVLGEHDPAALAAPGLRFRRAVARVPLLHRCFLAALEGRVQFQKWSRDRRFPRAAAKGASDAAAGSAQTGDRG